MQHEELFNFKKEYLFHVIESLRIGQAMRFGHQWRLRILFAVFSVSFLGVCATSKDFRHLPIDLCWKIGITVIFWGLFYLYDSQLGSLGDTYKLRGEFIDKRLQELPDKYNEPDSAKIPPANAFRGSTLCKRMWSRICQFRKLDFCIFYFLMALMWVLGWIVKEMSSQNHA